MTDYSILLLTRSIAFKTIQFGISNAKNVLPLRSYRKRKKFIHSSTFYEVNFSGSLKRISKFITPFYLLHKILREVFHS